jgi:hypothetical protein
MKTLDRVNAFLLDYEDEFVFILCWIAFMVLLFGS